MRGSVAADIRSIFTCPDLASAQARLKERAGFYSKSAPKLAAWMEENLPQGFVVHALPEAHRKRMRTSNAIERVNQELQRRPFDPFGFAQGIRGAQGLRHPRRLAVPQRGRAAAPGHRVALRNERRVPDGKKSAST